MGETIRLTAADGFKLGAYLARPSGEAKAGVVVAQEIFGVNAHIRSVCDRFAAQGYLTIAPALFDRQRPGLQLDYTPESVTLGRSYKTQANMDAVVRDLAAAAEAVASAGKVGLVGYCWGGLVVYLAACRLRDDFACASGYYGGGIGGYLDERPVMPLMLHFGELDASIPLDEVEAIRRAHPEIQIYLYEGAEHGFNCDRRPQFNAAAAELAGERTQVLFRRHLGDHYLQTS
jgi:carboxymethylenebutenolidase